MRKLLSIDVHACRVHHITINSSQKPAAAAAAAAVGTLAVLHVWAPARFWHRNGGTRSSFCRAAGPTASSQSTDRVCCSISMADACTEIAVESGRGYQVPGTTGTSANGNSSSLHFGSQYRSEYCTAVRTEVGLSSSKLSRTETQQQQQYEDSSRKKQQQQQ